MNERFEEQIFELAKQAGMLRDKFGLYWNAYDNPDDGVDLEKFAELIVRECAQLVQGVPTDTMGYHTADQKIKQHFGIES